MRGLNFELTTASKVLLIAGAILGLVMGVTKVWVPTISNYLFYPGQLLYVIAMILPQLGYVVILWAVTARQGFVAIAASSAMSVVPIVVTPIVMLLNFGMTTHEWLMPLIVVFWPAWVLLLGVAASVS